MSVQFHYSREGSSVKQTTEVYIVEDDSLSIRQAALTIAQEYPDAHVRIFTDPSTTLLALEDLQERKLPLPHLVILDLGFGSQSGFEILRYWRSISSRVPIIVWTELGATYQELSQFFGVRAVVSKSDGPKALAAAIADTKIAS